MTPPNKALQLTSHSAFQSAGGRVWRRHLGRFSRAAKALWLAAERRSVRRRDFVLEALGNIADFLGGLGVVVTLIYLVGALSFGLLVSSLAPSQAMAFQAGAVLSLLPAILLSGFIFPIRSMPVWLQAITDAVPARYYLIVDRGVIVKGAGLAPYGRDVMFLVIYAAATTALAFARLGRRGA